MKHIFLIPALAVMAACATTPAYGPAKSSSSEGYFSQQIETGRHRISYTDKDPVRARNMALLRASEVTLLEGKDWFEITSESEDSDFSGRRGGGTSVSVGGSAGSGGYSGVGVGIGIGFPLGGSSSAGKTTHSLEIVTGAGPKPDKAEAYDARSVDMNLRVTSG
ncbi:MAG: CC0125/CC1285 family lipoprotein [Hyphomonas sp.]